jgi:hypothetical protein
MTAITVPAFGVLPEREFSEEFHHLRGGLLRWMEPYYDREHLTRAGDWLLALAPDAPEPLALAALAHDLERSVPGGPVLDMARIGWDDADYNRRHCDRSADVVAGWMRGSGAGDAFVAGVREPIRQHEFGGSPEGDLMQAADSISFLEVNGPLVASWVLRGMCDRAKALEKLQWMYERIRLERARPVAEGHLRAAIAEMDRQLAAAGSAR